MRPRKATYTLHRWLGLVISLQLLAWSVGGFVFSVLDIRAVRGELDSTVPAERPLGYDAIETLSEPIRSMLERSDARHSTQLTLIDRGLGAHWEARDANSAVVARFTLDGRRAETLTVEDAAELARRDFKHSAEVSAVVLYESDPPIEYRGRPLPAFRVEFDHPKDTHIYVDASTGEITARRNRSWRVFDFFWMLHTMDYKGRDNFNHPLLTAASVLAVGTSASGIALWGWRALSRIRKKSPQGRTRSKGNGPQPAT